MRFKSLLNYFSRGGKKDQTVCTRVSPRRRRQANLLVELLESRDLLAAPSIISAGVLPVDGANISNGTPVIQIQFSQPMDPVSALNPNNYFVFGSAGRISVNEVMFVDSPTNTTVSLRYNGNEGTLISGASNANPISITTPVPHGLTSGNQVTVTGVLGNTAANGTWTVNVTSPTTFTLLGSNGTGSGAYTAGTGNWYLSGTVTNATGGGVSPIVITSANHGLATGDRVNVTGVQGNTNANGSYTVTVIDANSFSLDNTAGNASYTGGGTWDANDPLVVDTYSVFLRGDQVFDATNVPVSPKAQLVAANGGQNQVAVANLPGNGSIGAAGNYYGAAAFTFFPTVYRGAATADFNGDGLPDLVFGDTDYDILDVFLGQPQSVGGGFSQVADASLFFNFSPTFPDPLPVVAGDFNNDGLPDVAVACGGTNNITVFLNTGGGGTLSFDFGTVFATDRLPVDMAVGDLNNDGNQDLAVVVTGAAATTYLDILFGDGAGGFAPYVGFNKPGPVGTPSAIAIGKLDNDANTDIVVGGATGLAWLRGTGGGAFAAPTAISGGAIRAVAVGAIDAGSADDIVALTATQAQVWQNDGNAAFTMVDGGYTLTSNSPGGRVTFGDLNADGKNDIAASNFAATGRVNTLRNTIYGGTISNVTLNASNNYIVTSANHGLVTGQKVIISGVTGTGGMTASINNTWTVTKINANTFSLNASAGVGSYTSGGSWILTGNVTAAAVTASNDVKITSPNHGLVTGSRITITGITGTISGSANGTFTVTKIDNDNFTLNIAGATGTYTSGGTWSTLAHFVLPASSPYPVDSTPEGIVIADTNQDGFGDVLTSCFGNFDFSVLVGAGDGTLLSPTSYTGMPSSPRSVATGDLNADNIPDIAVINNGATPQVTVLLGKGDGTYLTPVNFTLPNSGGNSLRALSALAIGDVTGDGKPDIVVASSLDDAVGILFNSTAAGSTTPVFALTSKLTTGTLPTDILLADFNKDNKLDILVSHNSGVAGRGVSYLQQSLPAGTFSPKVEVLSGAGQLLNNKRIVSMAAGDFNRDGKLDFVAVDNLSPGNVYLVLGNDTGAAGFSSGGAYAATVPQVSDVAAADLNNDGYTDLVVASGSNAGFNTGVAVMLNQFGTGFASGVQQDVYPFDGLASVVVSDLNFDGIPDIIVSETAGGFAPDNVYSLAGLGGGAFAKAVPYLVGNFGSPTPANTYLALTGSPLVRVTTFTSGGGLIKNDIVNNGDFELRNLAGEAGNLSGWQTYKLLDNTQGSHGQWMTQTGGQSPLSDVAVPKPTGTFRAMLDQSNLDPVWFFSNPNTAADYAGTNVLYQDIFIPASTTQLKFSMTLYLNNNAQPLASGNPTFSDTGVTPTLDYRVNAANQQVRVDLTDPNDAEGILGVNAGVLKNLFITDPSLPDVTTNKLSYTFTPAEISQLSGRTIRLRVAAAYNQAMLVVGVDSVKMIAQFPDTVKPSITGLGLRNPGFLGNPNGNTPHTSDPTLIGKISDDGSLKNVAFIEFDPNNDGFGDANDIKTTQWDSRGYFSVTLPNVTAGYKTVGVKVIDRAGNFSTYSLPFFMQAASVTEWQAVGPQGIAVSAQGVDYDQVSGRVTAVVADQGDPSGNTYLIGSANGGIWKTTDGGANWTPLTDYVTDSTGTPVPVPIGGLAQSTNVSAAITNAVVVGNTVQFTSVKHTLTTGEQVSISGVTGTTPSWTGVNGSFAATVIDADTFAITPAVVPSGSYSGGGVWTARRTNTWYAGTGVGDLALDSKPGIGVLKSTDNGKTWSVAGNSGTVLKGARIVKIVVNASDPNFVFAAVASGGNAGPGVYKSSDGGKTWANTLGTPSTTLAAPNSNMNLASPPIGPGGTVPVGTALASVTDMVIDPFNSNHILIGLGNMGLVASSNIAGVWQTVNGGASWDQVIGGHNAALVTPGRLPTGNTVGRITLGIGSGRVGDEHVVYVLVADPPPAVVTPPAVNYGTFTGAASGLYKTKDNLLNFTKVMIRQYNFRGGPPHNRFENLNLLSVEGSNAGALAVDPNDPNVVYVGGSARWNPAIASQHGFVRVDTGHMRDTDFFDVLKRQFPNDGDDIDKYYASYGQPGDKNWVNNFSGQFYDWNPATAPVDPYIGEGVYWYDIIQNSATSFNPETHLPEAITSLTFDAQGRLVIGTVGGVWRGQNYGFSYDITSGGDGILAPFGPPTGFVTNAMTLTSINGNLQIADLTSVALDPLNPGTYYTTQMDTGSAGSNQPLTWVSQDVIGPAGLPIPNAGSIQAANPPPGSPPGTPITLYRLWQYGNANALQPEVSSDNGLTWNTLPNSGLAVAGSTAGNFPAFTVNPTPVLNGGQYYTELLFGTNKVFLTQTGGNAWFDITGRATLSGTGGLITAMAISPSNLPNVSPPQNAYYAATDKGEVFVTLNGGGDAWPLRNTGLPAGKKINGLTVHPANPYVVYAAIDGNGGYGHIWRGVTNANNSSTVWTDISANLPQYSAYKVVVDSRPGLGAPNGKIYVATEVGVYVSLNGGSSWQKLGAGLPNVPAVGLDFNKNLETLAVAAQGRGVFTINTSALSIIPNQVIDEDTPSGLIPFTVNDPGLPAGSYSISASSDNQALINNNNIILSGSGADRSVSFSPVANANGNCRITITLTSGSFTAQTTFTVTVNPINDLPTLSNIGTQVTLKNTPININFTIGDVETPANQLILSATSSNTTLVPNAPANLAFSGTGTNRTLTITPVNGQTGITTITLTVKDANNGTTTRTFDLLVSTTVGLPYADNFNRADAALLGPGWNQTFGSVGVASNQAAFMAPGPDIVSLNGLSATNLALQADVTVGANQDLGLIARFVGNSYYLGRINNTGGTYYAEIYVNVNGQFTKLTSKALAGAGSGTLRFEIADSSLKLFQNNVLVAWANDTNLTAPGTAGFLSVSGNTFADNFVATAINLATPTLPFTETFNTPGYAAGSQLSTKWVNRSGNFSVANQAVVAVTDTNASVATVFGLNLGSSLAQASVNVAATGDRAGVVARYSASGYYVGALENTASGVQANIYRYLPSTGLLKLAGALVANTTGTLRLEAVGNSLKLFLGGVQVAYAYDSLLPSGSTGIYATSALAVDDFTTNSIALTTPTFTPNPFVDNFSTPINGNQLSRNWTYQAGNFQITGGQLVSNDPGASIATVNGTIADVGVQADVTVPATGGQNAGVVARFSNAGYYFGLIFYTGSGYQALIDKYSPSTNFVTLAAVNLPSFAAGSTIRLEVAGTSLKFFVNGALVAHAFDAQLTTGSVGLRNTNGVVADNFQADAIVLTNPAAFPLALPFHEDFSTTSNGDQLSRNWVERQGAFSVSGNALRAVDPMNIATVYGAVVADTAVQADLTLLAGQNAGLIARYDQATGNYYLAAAIATSNTTSVVVLYRYYSGGYYLLGSANAGIASGTMLFECVGTTLKVFYGGNLLIHAVDAFPGTNTPVLASGLAGVRNGQGSVMMNFNLDQIAQIDPSAPPYALPYNENFFFPVNGNQLPRTWDERLGSFSVAGGNVTALEAMNIATVHGATLADTAVQADLNLPGGQNASLLARYDAAANSFYLAVMIANANASASTFYLMKCVNGNFGILASTPVGAISGANGTMRLEVANNNLKLFYGPSGGAMSLVLYAYDPIPLAAGLAGVRNSVGAKMTNFVLDRVPLAAPAGLPFNEFFNAPSNGNQLSYNWDERQGNFNDTGNAAFGVAAGANVAVVHGLSNADVSLSAYVGAGGDQQAGIIARYVNGNYYLAQIANVGNTTFTATIYRVIGGTLAAISPSVALSGPVGMLRFDVTGTSLKLYFNNNLVTYGFDSLLGAGQSGFLLSQNAGIAYFSLNTLAPTPATLPFTDDFSSGTALSTKWSERQGIFNINSGALFASAAISQSSIATINVNVADSKVSEDISLPATGTHSAGLIARYDAATGNRYLGRLVSVNGNKVAEISRIVNGVTTVLASAAVSGSGAGTLRFEVVGTSVKLFFAAALRPVAFANDSTLTGSLLSGIEVGPGDAVDNVKLDKITLTTPAALPFVENFNSTDGTQLSRNWVELMGNFSVLSSRLFSYGPVNVAVVNGQSILNADMTSDVFVGNNQQAGVLARYQSVNGSYYLGRIVNTNGVITAEIVRNNAAANPAVTKLATVTLGSTAGLGNGVLTLRVVGASLKLFYGPTASTQTLVAYAYDSTFPAGAAGLLSTSGAAFDNFRFAVAAVPTSQPATFTETFAASPPTQQLSSNWLERAGNFNLQTGAAAGQAGVNIATVQGISKADADLTAVVNSLNTANQYVSLIARYSGQPTLDTYYAAQIKYLSASNYQIDIIKVVGGIATSLGSTTTATFAGTLRFTAVGTSLSVYLDGSATAILGLTDSVISGAGAVGMGASAGARISSFTSNP